MDLQKIAELFQFSSEFAGLYFVRKVMRCPINVRCKIGHQGCPKVFYVRAVQKNAFFEL